MSHNERPDYDKLIRFFEKGKAKIPSYAGSSPKISPLVDNDVSFKKNNTTYSYSNVTRYS